MSKRRQEHVIEMRATPDQVWEAVATGEGIKRWFAPEARVTPGVGGEVFLSWGAECEGASRISIWEPGRHLQVTDERPASGEKEAAQMTVDYIIEGQGDTTILRLVHSGFGESASWDSEFESTNKGWGLFLTVLKHGVEHNWGQPVLQITPTRVFDASPEATVELLTGPRGLCREGSLPSDLRPGDVFHFTTIDGDGISGTVDRVHWPHLVSTLDSHGEAMFALFVDPHRNTKSIVSLMLVGYGDSIPSVRELGERWTAMLERLAAPATASA